MACKIDFTYPNKENCEFLENLNLSYKDMTEYFKCKVSVRCLEKNFRKYGIYHKTKYEALINDKNKLDNILFKKSIKEASIKYKCSRDVIIKIRKEYKMKLDSRIIKALDTLVWKNNYYEYLWKIRSLVINTTAEQIYKTENFPSDDLWVLMVELFGDYRKNIQQGWLNVFQYKQEIICFIDAITKTAREEFGFIND